MTTVEYMLAEEAMELYPNTSELTSVEYLLEGMRWAAEVNEAEPVRCPVLQPMQRTEVLLCWRSTCFSRAADQRHQTHSPHLSVRRCSRPFPPSHCHQPSPHSPL